MTTYTSFVPSPAAPFSFLPTLDGQQYNATVTWNLFGQRWYLTVATLAGVPVFSLPLAGSPSAINLVSLSWADGFATAVTDVPHGFLLDATVDLAIAGCTPAAYNGAIQALVVDPQTIEWPLASDPGPAAQIGTVAFNIDLAGGYFDSTLVFRESTQQFEVSP